MKLIVGISGATGVLYAIRMLEILRDIHEIETHLVISPAAKQTILYETNYTIKQVEDLANVTHPFSDIGASISSGSFQVDGMVVLPCSIKTLSKIAYSSSDNLLVRAADVILKEKRKLLLCPRETPLHLGHLRLLVQAAEIGAIIFPPMPAFYHNPKTIADLINQTLARIFDLLEIRLNPDLFHRWEGLLTKVS